MQVEIPETQEERAAKLTLISIFLTLVGAFSLREQRRGEALELHALDVALLGLAAYRGGRMVAYDAVAEPLRAPFTRTTPDSSGAGEAVDPRGRGARKVLGQLLSCPTCAGTWISAGLVYGMRILPLPTRLLITVLAATGLAELLDGLQESLTWRGREARERAGALGKQSDSI